MIGEPYSSMLIIIVIFAAWLSLRTHIVRMRTMSVDTSKLTAAVAANTAATSAATAVMDTMRQGAAGQAAADASVQAAVDAAATQVDANTAALGTATNPPAPPAPTA